jgi:hypothetical protein
MTSKTPGDRDIPSSDKLRDRALWCRRLAVGVANPKFAGTLKTIADDYESSALEMNKKVNPPNK